MALDPFGAADGLLDEVVSCLQGGGYPVPPCVFVSAGDPAADCCDQLVATLGRWTPVRSRGGTPGQVCGTLWRVDVTLRLYLCVPMIGDDGSFPSCEAQAAAAQGLQSQLAAIVECLSCACQDGNPACRARDVMGAKVTGPLGGCAVLEISVTVDLQDRRYCRVDG